MVARVRRTCVGPGRIRNSRVRNTASEGHEDGRSSKTGQTRSSACAPVALKRRTARRCSITATTQQGGSDGAEGHRERDACARGCARADHRGRGVHRGSTGPGAGFSALSRALKLEKPFDDRFREHRVATARHLDWCASPPRTPTAPATGRGSSDNLQREAPPHAAQRRAQSTGTQRTQRKQRLSRPRPAPLGRARPSTRHTQETVQ